MNKTSKQYIQEAKKSLQSKVMNETKMTDDKMQKMLFDLVKLVKENPKMKDSEVKKLVNGVQKAFLEYEIEKKKEG